MTDRPYSDPDKPGRLDFNGVEWWACDPYPTWYRWEDGELFTDHASWPDEVRVSSRPCPSCEGTGRVLVPIASEVHENEVPL